MLIGWILTLIVLIIMIILYFKRCAELQAQRELNQEIKQNKDFFKGVAADVLEHFSNPSQIQEEFKRVLKNGGYLVISGPTENLVYRISRRLIFWFWKKKEDHLSNVNDLIDISEKLFDLEECKSLPNSLIAGFKVYKSRVDK